MWFTRLDTLVFVFWLLVLTEGNEYDEVEIHLPVTRNPIELDKWVKLEISLLDKIIAITSLKKNFFRNNSALRNYTKDFKASAKTLRGFKGPVSRRVEAVTSNPVATYRFIRRMVNDLQELKLSLNEYPELFEEFPRTWPWLIEEDLDDAMLTILRINHVYSVDAESMSKGIFRGISSGGKLDAIHCYEIALHASYSSYYDLAIEWAELALKKAEGDTTVSVQLIQSALDDLITKHDEAMDDPLKNRNDYNVTTFDRKIAPIRFQPNFLSLRRRQSDVDAEACNGSMKNECVDLNFNILCSSGNLKTKIPDSTLFCWYESPRAFSWRLAPLKMELLSKNPDVLQVYDVIHDQRIERVQEISVGNLVQSRVEIDEVAAISKRRTSVSTSFDEKNYSDLITLPLLVEKITGLQAFEDWSSEYLQVASYTSGGHYDAHTDVKSSSEDVHGAAEVFSQLRIATFMFFLGQPQMGGETAFLHAGVSAKPIKGSAVFWYNVYSDGTVDESTLHGSCPVILGRKWVANKWIKYDEQFLNHKCGLQPKERFITRARNTSS